MKASRDLELLVTKIQKQLAPKAEVLHNVMLDGRESRRKRQIDILVREKIGQYDIQIIIDCKDYVKPVDVKGVEEFYGLLCDVGAQKGVLVCPTGFTGTAKIRADGLQIDLYSPFDTDPHKWQVNATIPALCDFRSALMSFGMTMSAPYPFRMHDDFFSACAAFDSLGNELGTSLSVASRRWNAGEYPSEVGEHDELKIYGSRDVMMDNGYGLRVPIEMYVSLLVKRQLFFGQLPVPQISGFKDEFSGKVITNAFTIGLLDPETIEREWLAVDDETDAPIRPVITVRGLLAWSE